jgi:hypothetical protein
MITAYKQNNMRLIESDFVIHRVEEYYVELDYYEPYHITAQYKFLPEERRNIYSNKLYDIVDQVWHVQSKFNATLYRYFDIYNHSKWKRPISFEFIDYNGTDDGFYQGYNLNEVPHIHGIYFSHPANTEKMNELIDRGPTSYFQSANRELRPVYSVDIRPIEKTRSDIKYVTGYSSKFCKNSDRKIQNDFKDVKFWEMRNHGIYSPDHFEATRRKTFLWRNKNKI